MLIDFTVIGETSVIQGFWRGRNILRQSLLVFEQEIKSSKLCSQLTLGMVLEAWSVKDIESKSWT